MHLCLDFLSNLYSCYEKLFLMCWNRTAENNDFSGLFLLFSSLMEEASMCDLNQEIQATSSKRSTENYCMTVWASKTKKNRQQCFNDSTHIRAFFLASYFQKRHHIKTSQTKARRNPISLSLFLLQPKKWQKLSFLSLSLDRPWAIPHPPSKLAREAIIYYCQR